MNWLLSSIIAFASAAIASMGIGGGAVLLLFLTVFSDIPLATAQGINLLFFLPIGALYWYNGHVSFADVLPYLPGGIAGSVFGGWLLPKIPDFWLKKVFSLFILYAAVRLFLK